MKSREEKSRREEEKELEESRYGCGSKCKVWIKPRSHTRSRPPIQTFRKDLIQTFDPDLWNDIMYWWVDVWFLLLLNFPCCDEWAVHSVICCRWCENWNDFFWCFAQCAHGLVKTWWCQWLVCWMSRAQCDLLLVAWESEWVFFVFYNTVRLVLLRFGDVSGCAEWAVHSVIRCWWCEFWRWREIRFFCVPAVVAWVLGRWRELRPPPSICNSVVFRCFWRQVRWYVMSSCALCRPDIKQ